METVINFINTKLDITGDVVFNGLDLALWPFLIGIYWLMYRVLFKETIVKIIKK